MEEGFIIEKLKIERDREGDTVITVKMNKRGGEGKKDELVDE